MKNKYYLSVTIIILLLSFFSCKSNKDLTYIQNLPNGDIQNAIPFSVADYSLRKGDNLYIQIKSIDPEVSQLFNPMIGDSRAIGTTQQYGNQSSQYINGYQLDSDGNIELPIIGKIYLKGKTLEEAKELLRERVSEFFKQASVTVKLLSFKYTVMGEVNTPGVYYNYNNDCNILEAISQANGTTDYAKLKKVVILRQEQSGIKSIEVDLSDKSLITSNAYFLRPNDVVYVSPDKYKNTRLNSPFYSLMLSSVSTFIVILKYLSE